MKDCDPELKAKLQELDAALAATPAMSDGVGDPFMDHFKKIRDAIAAFDVVGALTEVRNLLNHILNDEGMRSTAKGEMKAFPWMALITTLLQLLELFKK